MKETRITTICDVDLNVTGRARKAIANSYGQSRKLCRIFAGYLTISRSMPFPSPPQSLACSGHLGLPGGQGCLCGKTRQP